MGRVHDVRLRIGDHVILVARVEDGGVLRGRAAAHVLPAVVGRVVLGPLSEQAEPFEIAAIEVSGRDLRWQGAEFFSNGVLVFRMTLAVARLSEASVILAPSLTCHRGSALA